MMHFTTESFDELANEVGVCLENLQHPDCTLQHAGRFYELAADCLRAHAILRLLIDANPRGFSNDLVMSGQARRAWLRRCQRHKFADYSLALSRSGSMLDAIAGDDSGLATEVFALSPTEWREGDEYQDDFCYQRYLGLCLAGAPLVARAAALARLEGAADGAGARLETCRALQSGDSQAFEAAFQALLRARTEEVAADAPQADEELTVAIDGKVFIEGVAVLKLARRAGLSVASEYPMCPTLALLPQAPAQPKDEFSGL